jgi:3-hydroxyisobutyrate dehydrogenase-like beta-hydroxyacid dehydrogenase
MTTDTIAILMPGDMGHAVGRALREHGHNVITCLSGRGEHTQKLAAEAGLTDAGSLRNVVEQADMILSILPPAAAAEQARSVAIEMTVSGKSPIYVDCNAVSPKTAVEIAGTITGAGAPFIDAGIIGLAPGHGSGPRFYVSGPDLQPMMALKGKGFDVIAMGEAVGEASALKMVYAGLTKGTWTLHTAVLLAAQRLGITDTLLEELEFSQKPALAAMRARVPFLPADSGRWIGEMEEIAETLSDAGVTRAFHDGAADIFRLLAKTPYASETRQTMDIKRTLKEALSVYQSSM